MNGLRLAWVVRNRWPPVALILTSGQTDLPSTGRSLSSETLSALRSRGRAAPSHLTRATPLGGWNSASGDVHGQSRMGRNIKASAHRLSQFSTRSLGESNIEALMLDACLRSRVGLNVTHAKLMEYIPERDRLLLRGDRARSSPDLPAGSRFQTSHRSLA